MHVLSDVTDAGVRVLTLSGNFDTAAAQVHGKHLVALADRSIALNMKEMAFIASSGLRVLLQMARACKKNGNRLVLCHVNELGLEIFSISGFDKMLEITEDEVSAVHKIRET